MGKKVNLACWNREMKCCVISACPKTPLPPGGVGGGKDNILISFTPTPTLPQREREKQSFRTGTNYEYCNPLK